MSVSNSPKKESLTIFSTLSLFPNDEKTKTRDFLAASQGVVALVEKFGKVFAPVIYDMNGNIQKIAEKYEEDVTSHEFIEDMILKYKNEGELMVVDALQWLRRGLHFIARFFQAVIEDTDNNNNSQDLSPFIKNAYRHTLERYHGWLGSQLFNILSRFVPNRKQLFYQLALEIHNHDDQVLHDLRIYTQKMESCVEKLVEFYKAHDLETNDRV